MEQQVRRNRALSSEAVRGRASMWRPSGAPHPAVWSSGQLLELLGDDDRINLMIHRSEKVRRLQKAAEKILVSNENLARVNLSQQPKLMETKLLLSVKYKELERLRDVIQVKRELLGEKSSLCFAQLCLLRRMDRAEEELELCFQRFTEGTTPLEDFLDSFLSSRILHHVRLVVLKKLEEVIRVQQTQGLVEVPPEEQRVSEDVPQQICSLTSTVLLPVYLHPSFLLPVNLLHCVPPSPPPVEAFLDSGGDGDLRWPTRPNQLQPLKLQQRRNKRATK